MLKLICREGKDEVIRGLRTENSFKIIAESRRISYERHIVRYSGERREVVH